MVLVCSSSEELQPFSIYRYQASKRRVDVGPKVSSLEISEIDVDNIKVIKTRTLLVKTQKCEVHTGCIGHLRTSDDSNVLLPSWCVSDDPEMQDKRSRATEHMISGIISPQIYSSEIRSTLMGKRGLARFRLLGVSPLASIRAVATCAWDLGKHDIEIPRSWMERMSVPYRKCSHGELSPYFSFRPALDGDFGVLIRDPIVTDSSIQPVTIRGWNGSSIRIHPEMCVPLNLDYDGDEVHVLVISSPEAQSEISKSIKLSSLSKFDYENWKDFVYESDRSRRLGETDFLVGTTASMSQLSRISYDSSQCGLARCKEPQRKRYLELMDTGPQSSIDATIGSLEKSCINLAASNLSVPMGYMLGRQLKIAASTVTSTLGIPVVLWPRAVMPSSEVCIKNYDTDHPAYGYPAMRLASRLIGGVMQNYLDMAKGRSVSSDNVLMNSLFTTSEVYYSLVDRKGVVETVMGDVTDPIDNVIASTSPLVLRTMNSDMRVLRSCCTLTKLACMKMKVEHSNSEVLELSCLVYWSFKKTGGFSMTSTGYSRFLSSVGADFMTSSLCESVSVMEEIEPDSKEAVVTANKPYVAVPLGNLSSLMHLSVGHQP